jgi:hypothetical protein
MALRLMTAAIVTIPIMLKLGVALRGQGLLGTVMLTLGGSAIFPYIIAEGLYYAPSLRCRCACTRNITVLGRTILFFNSWRKT